MNSIDGLKTCRKGLHQYPADKKRCPECHAASCKQWQDQNRERYLKRNRENSRRWREQNPQQNQNNVQRWHEKNPERVNEYKRRWREKNREQVRETNRRWRKQNSERQRELTRRWGQQNSHKIRANTNRRRANKKQATPSWADHAAINSVYAEVVKLEKETKIKYHVDHIYPLQSDYMCGLHVAENLQILPGPENLSKGNRTWPGQLECQRLPIHMNGFDSAA